MNQSAPLTNLQTRDIESLLHPYTPIHRLRETGTTVIERGEGVFVFDTQGKRYIEGMSGLWCAGLGFGDEEMIDAATQQLRTLPYYHLFGAKSLEPAIELAEKLKEIAPVPISKVFFTSSGSEANDTQVKLAWYMNNARGKPQKKKIISRIKAYHGVTIMSASLTGLPYNHIGWDLPVDRVLHTDCPHYYRFGQNGESEAEFVARIVKSLADLIEREGADTIAAFIAEPVMGAGGVIVPPKGYYEAIGQLLAAHDIIMIDDEVINGFGRTGNWWGCQTLGMTPTTISAAKQLTAAYAPLGAVMVPEDIYQAYEDHSRQIGTFGHGFTYGGHPLGCALGVKAIENLPEARHRRPGSTYRAAVRRPHGAPFGASAGRRNSPLRADGRRGTGRRQEDEAPVRPQEGRRSCGGEAHRGRGRDPARHRRHDRALPAHGHHRGRARRPVRLPRAGTGQGRGLGGEGRASEHLKRALRSARRSRSTGRDPSSMRAPGQRASPLENLA
jgi:4-aminobutyrate--pyruvate transaminase